MTDEVLFDLGLVRMEWLATPELRWQRHVWPEKLVLQQRWVSNTGAEEWRDIPQVLKQ